MRLVAMPDLEANIAQLVEAVESGTENEVVIARNGKPAARIVPVEPDDRPEVRIGLFDGLYRSMSLEELNATNAEIEKLFYGDSS